jgi:hypothetical protein
MATYVLPQVLVFQDFQQSISAQANPLRAHITGPHAFLLRYSDADERPLGQLGYYDEMQDESFLWPSRPAGAKVDATYTKLWVQDAILKYFEDTVGGGSTMAKVAGYSNRVRSSSVNFKDNGAYVRDASLLDRDVQLGDVVKARFLPDGEDPITLWTYVKGFAGDPVAAVIAEATNDDDNAATNSEDVTVTKTGGADNCITATGDASAYDGLADGNVTETYTVTVIASSSGGNHTTARLRVVSASGNDDVASAVPSEDGVATAIGTRGLTLTFASDAGGDCSLSATNDDVSPIDLVVGQEWTVAVTQAFTETVATSDGTYTGDADTTYIVEVTRGGLFAGTVKPRISVSTTTGVDISGPTVVSAAASAVAVGTEGVTVAFGGSGLRKGDRFYIGVTAEAEGPMRTLILGHNISEDVVAGSDCDLTLYIRKPLLQIEANRTHAAPLTNWETSETEFTVHSGIEIFDETWTDDGVPVALPLHSESSREYGLMFVEYRAWRSDLCNEINGISDVGNLDADISGALTPDNPLKWALFKALSNSNGVEVKYTAVCDPDDVDSWLAVLEQLLGRDDVYGLVPLTRNQTVLDAYAAHVDGQSAPDRGLWRVAWFSLAGVPEIPIIHAGSTVPRYTEATTTNGNVCQAVIVDDPDTSGTQYTRVRVAAGNANFITNGVRPGDILRVNYAGDGFGNFTYSEYVVDEVQTEDQLRLLTGPASAVNVASKIEIWRTLSATAEAAEIARNAGSYSSRRVRAVWPDRIESSGTIQEGFHLCAALAGLTSGVVPHQNLTQLAIAGFTDVARTTAKFNRPQLDVMVLAGVWIVTQDPRDGEVYTRHAVTTADHEILDHREEMVTRNLDSISYRFKDTFAPFIGVTNVTPSLLGLLEIEAQGLIETLKTERFSVRLGAQLIDATISELIVHPTLKDRVVMRLNCRIPRALNNLEIHLTV